MVVSPHPIASRAGLDVLKNGGNAADAALTVSFVLAVVRPQSTGIGGGGFALVGDRKDIKAYDFREKAPLLAHKDMFKIDTKNKKLSINGHLASGVPGFVAGWLHIHNKYGSKPLQELLQPAILLARKGVKVNKSLAQAIGFRLSVLKTYPASSKIFLPKSKPLKEGDLLVQKDLANTIEAIADNSSKEFYQGPTADKIISEMSRGGFFQKKRFVEL